MPRVTNPNNLYSDTATGKMSPRSRARSPACYVPNRGSNTVSVIDPATMQVVDTFNVGHQPAARRAVVGPEDALGHEQRRGHAPTARSRRSTRTRASPAPSITVDDPYNMYFTPDGKSAIVVAEARKRLDFLDPHTMQLQGSLDVPDCAGVNHADFSIDGKFAIFTCEFQGSLVKIDIAEPDGGGLPHAEPGRDAAGHPRRRPTATRSTSPR